MRNKISFSLKIVVVIAAFAGVIWSFFSASADGYSDWSKRLLYFTAQSNIWIAFCFIAILIIAAKRFENSTRVKKILYLLRYVFTVSITLTGFIFCFVLAPGAEKGNYNAWTGSSILTHVIVPTFSIVDFFVDGYRVKLKKSHVPLVAVPPFLYMVFATVLVVLKVDFGRGDVFPYFFFNYYSPAGVFGFSDEMPYIVGSFYWMVTMLLMLVGMGAAYRALYTPKKKDKTKRGWRIWAQAKMTEKQVKKLKK